ncbi:MAG: DNA-binding protein, partial [Paludibacteraceae bacterium]|nr:DNA-binding protein [Paludibacteraceae bacterium]
QSFISQAQKEIILIDNYVDLSVLERLATKNRGVDVTIYTLPNTRLTAQDVRTFNTQYPTLTVKHTSQMHDRFLIIDNSILYHVGASLKDLGKKCFAFDLFEANPL